MTVKTKKRFKRDDKWLLSRLDCIWNEYFTYVVQKNRVFIKFGRFAKYRLGSVRLNRKNQDTYITITSMFRQESVPQAVVDQTIAHELVHYSHGFSSIHPKLHKYPHAGGVVRQEMRQRGMEHLYQAYRNWVKTYRRILMKRYV